MPLVYRTARCAHVRAGRQGVGCELVQTLFALEKMASPKETGVAFGMVGGAGLATTVGGFIVYSAKLGSHVRLLSCFFSLASVVVVASTFPKHNEMGQSPLYAQGFLGGALAFSAGVMVYISFVDIFFKSVEEFEAAGLSRRRASQLTTAPFFGGCFLVWLMDRIIHSLHASPRHLAAAFAARRLEEGPHFTAGEQSKVTPEGPDPESDNTDSEHGQPRKASERTDLRKLGWLTALSISLHNCATHIGSIPCSRPFFLHVMPLMSSSWQCRRELLSSYRPCEAPPSERQLQSPSLSTTVR